MWPYPKVVAHRGGGKLAPENTIAGLRCGLEHGFRAVEFDVMLARDGVPVVVHDPILGRTVNGIGKVPDYDAAELARMDAGSWFARRYAGEPVPLFTEYVSFCRQNRIWMNVEIKPAPGFEAETGRVVAAMTAELFADEMAAGDPRRLPLLSSFSLVALEAAMDVAPGLPRALLLDAVPGDWEARARSVGAVAIHANANPKKLSQAFVRQVREAGFGLFCYTVNDPQWARQILGWGVEAFCTDRIDIIGPDFAG